MKMSYRYERRRHSCWFSHSTWHLCQPRRSYQRVDLEAVKLELTRRAGRIENTPETRDLLRWVEPHYNTLVE